MFFGIAYAFLFGPRHWVVGIVFALLMEVIVFSLYPGWLDLDKVLKEFTIVSLTGHVAYGLALGLICNSRLRMIRQVQVESTG